MGREERGAERVEGDANSTAETWSAAEERKVVWVVWMTGEPCEEDSDAASPVVGAASDGSLRVGVVRGCWEVGEDNGLLGMAGRVIVGAGVGVGVVVGVDGVAGVAEGVVEGVGATGGWSL